MQWNAWSIWGLTFKNNANVKLSLKPALGIYSDTMRATFVIEEKSIKGGFLAYEMTRYMKYKLLSIYTTR